jgi:hypothetical protein
MVRALGPRSYSIEAFNWSGSNSILARKRASLDLAQLIDERISAGVTDLIAIGHSHGGNVIVDAMELTKHNLCNLTIITLATPFLTFVDKVQSVAEAAIYYFGYFLSISCVCAALGLFDFEGGPLLAFLAFWALYYRTENTLARDLLVVPPERSIANAVVAVLLLPKHFLDEVFSMSEIKFKRPRSSSDHTTTKIYTLRSPRDEASLAIGVSSFISKWSEFVPRIVWTAGLLSSALLLGSLMLAMSNGAGKLVSSFEGRLVDYFALLVGFVIFTIMFAVESVVLRGLAEQFGSKRLAHARVLSKFVGVWLRSINDIRSHIINLVLAGVLFVILIGMQIGFGVENTGKINSFDIIALGIGFFPIMFLFYGSFLVLMTRMVCGRELFFRRLNAGVVIGAVPMGQTHVTAITIPATKWPIPLRHSIYDNPVCRQKVAEILLGRFGAQK